MKKKALILAAALAIALFSLAQPAVADHRIPISERGRAVMIIMDKVTWADLVKADAPNLKKLAAKGSVGLLSNRTAKAETTSIRSYLTIGTGSRADGRAPGGNPINKSRFKALTELNKRTGYNAKVGLLATELRRRGFNIAVFGNADAVAPGQKAPLLGREVEWIGVDAGGAPAPGDTSGNVLSAKSGRPGRGATSINTDYGRLMAAVDRQPRPGPFIIETGDTRRADIAGLRLDRSSAWSLKKQAIGDADRFIGRVARRLDLARDLLIVVSPSPPLRRDGSPSQALTPIIVAGPKIGRGLLTSPSTRRAGLVAGTDIAPTLAGYFGVVLPEPSVGRPMTSQPGKATFRQMAAQARQHLLVKEISMSVFFGYSFAAGALLTLIVLGLVLAKRTMSRAYQAVRLALLSILCLPPAIFISPLIPFSFSGKTAHIMTIAVLALAFTVIAWLLPERTLSPLIFVTGGTALFLIVNLLLGAPAEAKSAFGYKAITGGRFYGIGNEFLSFLLPALLIAVMLSLEKWRPDPRAVRLPLAAFFAAVIFMVGYGGLGANTGGIIMTTPAFVLAYCGLYSRRPRWLQGFIAVVATTAALAALAVVDAVFPAEPAHLGQLTRHVYSGTPAVLAALIERKLMLNIEIFNYSYWSYVIVGILIALLVWQARQRRSGVTRAPRRHPKAGLALFSGVAGGLAGALANDSGIAVLAIVLGYLLMVLLYLEVSDQQALNLPPSALLE